jgi:hypothetical protein
MWWDAFPCLVLPGDPTATIIDEAILSAMEMTLALDSIACQESALHGLGHAQRRSPARAPDIIDAYLGRPHPPRIDAYAGAARCGCVL